MQVPSIQLKNKITLTKLTFTLLLDLIFNHAPRCIALPYWQNQWGYSPH